MQLTIRNVPVGVKKRIHAEAKAKCKSLNQHVVDLLSQAAGVKPGPKQPKRDLSFLRSSNAEAKAVESAKKEFDAIDPETWR